jgi:opacity protein-like surface antigen
MRFASRIFRQSTYLIILLLFSARAFAADKSTPDDPPTAHFAIAIYGGPTFGSTDWYFIQSDHRFPVYSALTIGGAIQYGPILKLDGAQLFASVEIAHGEIGTDEQDISNQISTRKPDETYTALMSIERMPIMFWLTVVSDNRLSPFVRAGVGTSRTDFRELYSFMNGPSVSFHRWDFTWGIGGGLDFRLASMIDVALFLDDWVTTSDMFYMTATGGTNGLNGPYKMTAVGIRTSFRF